jgi:hypothetical protein
VARIAPVRSEFAHSGAALKIVEGKVKVHSFLEGAGIAILLLLNYLWPLLSPYHLAVYHTPGSFSPVAGGFAIDLVLSSVIFTGLLVLLDRYQSRYSTILWAVLLALLVVKAIHLTVFLLYYYQVEISLSVTAQTALLCIVPGIAVLLSQLFPHSFARSVRAARLCLVALGCCVLWMLPQLVFTAVRTHAPSATAFSRRVQPATAGQGRIVWVLLDELSYDQVFEHRQADVELPNFDALRNESVLFSNVQPAGYYTERILPSLFIGREFDNLRSSLRRDLYVHDAQTATWEPFDENASIFAEAKRWGWSAGIAGWYNPYCQILRDVLDSCYWQYLTPLSDEAPGVNPKMLDMAAVPVHLLLLHFGLGGATALQNNSQQLAARQYTDLAAAADALIRNEPVRFVFLHLPVPHPPGIYDRKTNRFGANGTYLDNLVLADRTIGNLLEEIQKTAVASQTTLIVSSDHSWRVSLWRAGQDWTPEEERASGGKFDPRPVLMIHFPESDIAALRSERFPELAIHDILAAMLKEKIQSQADLDAWLGEYEKHDGQPLLANQR